ncbi:MAG: polysulfide reductase [Thermodesulfatator sp.]|nr:MAG: polysulfide reductase [Thermodesulfatator sp.]
MVTAVQLKRGKLILLFLVSLCLLGVGVIMGIRSFLVGHGEAYGVSREIPWGILISTYVFWAGLSCGLSVTSAVGHLLHNRPLGAIGARSVFLAIATIFAGFLAIGLELENPWRLPIWVALSPNLRSNIWWMGTLYTVYVILLLLEFTLMTLGKHKASARTGLLAGLSDIAAFSNLGAVFALLAAHPFWYGTYIPTFFIPSALMNGAAAIIFFTWLAYRLSEREMEPEVVQGLQVAGKIYGFTIAICIFFLGWKIAASIAGKPYGSWEAIMALLKGPLAFNFWVFEVCLGLVIPLLVIIGVRARDINAMAYVGGLSLIAAFVMRYDQVVAGQLVPHYAHMHIYGLPQYYHYAPSLCEWLIVIGSLGLFGALFAWGEMAFKGHPPVHH